MATYTHTHAYICSNRCICLTKLWQSIFLNLLILIWTSLIIRDKSIIIALVKSASSPIFCSKSCWEWNIIVDILPFFYKSTLPDLPAHQRKYVIVPDSIGFFFLHFFLVLDMCLSYYDNKYLKKGYMMKSNQWYTYAIYYRFFSGEPICCV